MTGFHLGVREGVDLSFGVSNQMTIGMLAVVGALARHGEKAVIIQIEYEGHTVYFDWGSLTSAHMQNLMVHEVSEALPPEYVVRSATDTPHQGRGLAVSWLPGVQAVHERMNRGG